MQNVTTNLLTTKFYYNIIVSQYILFVTDKKMLKWAVYGKKNQDVQPIPDERTEEPEPFTNEPYANKTRRSLDAQEVKKSKKPSRYQRRSLGSAARKNIIRTVDKENINYIGNTPNYYKEGFVKKSEALALKDVSNITPTSVTPVKNFERRRYYLNGSKDDIPPDLPPTPPSYSRKVREAKKRKLEMTSTNNDVFSRDSRAYKSERRIKPQNKTVSESPKLSHSTSEPSLNELSDRLSATTTSSRNSFALGKTSNFPISTTKTTSEGLVEIEYDEDLVLNCIEKPLTVNKACIEKTTLPIFGHHIFMDNPLYFNKNEGLTNLRPLKRTRKKSNEFESSFKSPSIDKKDTHSLVRDGCSPIRITPLSTKLAALRFSTMSTHSKSQRTAFKNDAIEYFPKVENPFTIPLKDEESSAEMENKCILGKDSMTNVTESTVSTTQMGDVTLEKMIEDIIKSTKIVKSRRRILNKNMDHNIDIEEEIPPLDSVKDLFVNPQAENKANLIKEAKYVNLSRENSVSPKNSPNKKKMPILRVNDRLLKNLPFGCFILDDGDGYNEREVKTPENYVEPKPKDKTLSRSKSMKDSNEKGNLENTLSRSTPDLYSSEREANLRLRRQRCIRRKKSTLSNESTSLQQLYKPEPASILTLEMGIPSPVTELHNVSLCEPLSSSFTDDIVPLELVFEKNDVSIRSNVSHSSLMPNDSNIQNKRSRELFGLTLENGIPSPITPVPNLKRSSNVLSEERAHKTSKLDEDNMILIDAFTPVIEHKSSRRCLTYSPEESINSSEEKRRSVASNRLERSCDRFQALKGTIDLEIVTRNDVIDVHGEW